MNIKFKIIVSNLIFILALFPYISVFHLPFEIQPYALILASLFSLFLIYEDKFTIPKPLKVLGLFFFIALLSFLYLILINNFDILIGIRSLAGYLSIFSFSLVGYKTFIYIKSEFYKNAVFIWLLGTLSQLILGVMSVSLFISVIRTDSSRGVTSFATEPAFYATICISFLILNEFFYLKKKYGIKTYVGLFILLLLQIILSYSGVGIMLLILFGLAKMFEFLFIKNEKINKILSVSFVILIILSIFLFLNNRTLENKRAGDILKKSVSDPISLIQNDYSISNRLMNPVLGIYGGLVEEKGFGFGVGSKQKDLAPDWLSKIRGSETKFGGKIEGGLVQSIYELGFIGVILIFTVFWIVIKSILVNKKMRPALIVSLFSLFIPIFIFGSLSVPLLGYILGIHLYYIYNID